MGFDLMGLAHRAVHMDLNGEDIGNGINKNKNNILGTVLGAYFNC